MNVEVAICYCAPDAALASDLASYLEFHTSFPCQLAAAPGEDVFLDVIEQCLTHPYVVLVLSKCAVPKPWPRDLWEPVLLEQVRQSGVHMAFVWREPCTFLQLLLRRGYFDFSGDFTKAARDVRRWLIQHKGQVRQSVPVAPEASVLDEELLSLLDQPGILRNVSSGAAARFAYQHGRGFEAVYWMDCAHAGEAAVLGEVAQAMQLRMPGTLAENRERIAHQAMRERALFVFDRLGKGYCELAEIGGKASVIVSIDERPMSLMTLMELASIFTSPGTDDDERLQAFRRYQSTFNMPLDWPLLYPLAARVLRTLKSRHRLAEAFELLAWMASLAAQHMDWAALENIRWEEEWILDEWDLPLPERARNTRTNPIQLSLPLSASA